MRAQVGLLATISLFVFAMGANAQEVVSQTTQALHSSLAAQAGKVTVQDITLSGTAESIVGSDDETVSVSFKAIASGAARSDVNLSSGTLSEVRQANSAGTKGVWAKDGTSHAMAEHNLLIDAAWFFPQFIVQRLLSDPNAAISYIGVENGTIHLQSSEGSSSNLSTAAAAQIQHLSQIDLYLDATSFVPVGLAFNIHPDNNALVDIPVYIQFSNYQETSGVTVPMHIQKYVNNTLTLDVQVQSAAINTGLASADFIAQ